ncbi:MAG: pilus assembly protein TadG-related protein [Endozoicomonas sp.]
MAGFGRSPLSQRGAVTLTAALTMIGLLAFSGLAIDFGRLLLHNTRLQNAVETAALSAARTYHYARFSEDPEGGARRDGLESLRNALAGRDFGLNDNSLQFTFTPATDTATSQVRVSVEQELKPLLLRLGGLTSFQARGRAVAGAVRNNRIPLTPMLACATSGDFSEGSNYLFRELNRTGSNSGSNSGGAVGFRLLMDGAGSDLSSLAGADQRVVYQSSAGMLGNGQPLLVDPHWLARETPVLTTVSIPASGNPLITPAQALNTRFGRYEGDLAEAVDSAYGFQPDSNSIFVGQDGNACSGDAKSCQGSEYARQALEQNQLKVSDSGLITYYWDENAKEYPYEYSDYAKDQSAFFPADGYSQENRRVLRVPLQEGCSPEDLTAEIEQGNEIEQACFFLLEPAWRGSDGLTHFVAENIDCGQGEFDYKTSENPDMFSIVLLGEG